MNLQERKEKINSIKGEIKTLNEALYVLSSECPHEIKNIGESAICHVCGYDFGWYCPESSTHICEYTTDECCDHCGEPEERK